MHGPFAPWPLFTYKTRINFVFPSVIIKFGNPAQESNILKDSGSGSGSGSSRISSL